MELNRPAFDRWIELSETPGHPNLFFLEPMASRITFYSQQVRALRLVHALLDRKRIKKGDRIAVIGAGAAGLSAAAAAALAGVEVELYESGMDILPLQSDSPRFLHPHIYEWPNRGALDDYAVLPLLDWRAGRGGDVSRQLTASFNSLVTATELLLKLRTKHTLNSLVGRDDEWLLEFKNEGSVIGERLFSHVVLAIGFGDENKCGDSPLVNYWRDRGEASNQVEMEKIAYFISGSGDGGLTDALAVLLNDFKHHEFTNAFVSRSARGELAKVVRAVEEEVGHGEELWHTYEARVLPVLSRNGLVDLVSNRLRKDRTLMFNAAVRFAKGKAARLNQVMMLALVEATKGTGTLKFSSGDVAEVIKRDSMFEVKGPICEKSRPLPKFHRVILRHGPNKNERFAPVGNLFSDYRRHYAGLLDANASLHDPPRIHPQTFFFFANQVTERTNEPGARSALSSTAKLQSETLLLTWEPAEQQVVQQGAQCFLAVLSAINAQPHPWRLLVACSPNEFKSYKDVIGRSILASAGKLSMEVTGQHVAAWNAVDSNLTGPPHFLTPFDPEPFPTVEALMDALNVILVGLLEKRLEKVVESQTCERLGSIHSTIADTLLPTWRLWRSAIDSDRALRSEFLRLLFQVDLAGTRSWDGDHACLPHLVSALVLLLATHVGEALCPAKCPPGNVSFAGDGIGLGSGCELIRGSLVEDFDDPDEWNVDALVLSQARVEMFKADDLITDGGTVSNSLLRAKRVRPATVSSSKRWRQLLAADVGGWKTAVETEFSDWRERHREALRET
jgi:NAD(P)-binding Rossmann-like domain